MSTLPFSAQGNKEGFKVVRQLYTKPHLGLCVFMLLNLYFTRWSLQCPLTWHYLLSDRADNIIIANNVHSGI